MKVGANSTLQLRVERISFAPNLFTRGQRRNLFVSEAHALLKQISFQVNCGDRVVIVGPSGAGKTLLLRLLNRLSEPTSGTIYLADQAYQRIPVTQLRQQVVLVLQESKLLGMTVRQALEYPLILRRLDPSLIQQRVAEWIDRLGIPADWLDRTELQLSVGQRQWVAIARALVTQPRVLLLDEPTSALDVGRSHQILQTLTELTEAGELSVLMTNHQLQFAQKFGTRVLHLENGTLVQDVSAAEMDWETLEQDLVQAEARHRQEWDD